MNASNRVLLASHGTEGARMAEQKVFEICAKGTRIHHLVVVPEFWKGMTGDDWLNNGSTRDRFRSYLESELEGEIRQHVAKVQAEAEAKEFEYTAEVRVGKPEKCLLDTFRSADFDLVVMGSPRPKGRRGLRCRMRTESLVREISSPLLIVPYPHE